MRVYAENFVFVLWDNVFENFKSDASSLKAPRPIILVGAPSAFDPLIICDKTGHAVI